MTKLPNTSPEEAEQASKLLSNEFLWQLLEECRDFVADCVGSSYHDSNKEDDEFLEKLDKVLANKESGNG